VKRRTFLAIASSTLAAVTNVVHAKSEPGKPDVLVFKIEPKNNRILNMHETDRIRQSLEQIQKTTGCMIVIIQPPVTVYRVGDEITFASVDTVPRNKTCIVRCRVTGEEIPRVIWAESRSGLVCTLDGSNRSFNEQLSHFPGGIVFEWSNRT